MAAKREHPDGSVTSALCDAGLTDTQTVSLLLVLQIGGLGPIGKKVDYCLLLLSDTRRSGPRWRRARPCCPPQWRSCSG